MKKSESSCTTDKNVYGAAILENSLAVPQIVKYKVTTYIFLGIHPRELKQEHKNLYTNIHSNTLCNSPKAKDHPNVHQPMSG